MTDRHTIKKTWSESLLQSLESNPEFVKLYILPVLIFLFDFFLRLFIGVDLIDAGADMALIAVTLFLMMIVEDYETQPKQSVTLALLLLFLLPWMFCLWGVSYRHNEVINVGSFSINMQYIWAILSWIVGINALIVSGTILEKILSRKINSTRDQ